MSQNAENLDFSGLFKLDVLIHLDISTHSFYEIGLKKFLALSSGKELVFLYLNPQSERFDNNYDWDFVDNPIYCMCFEPSGTWVLIVSDQKILLVPFLPLFIPQNSFDCKWSLSSVTVLPLVDVPQPTSVVWWLTKESENIIIIGSKNGTITFYSLESQCVVGEAKVSGEVVDLQICFDDSLDLLALLISRGPTQQLKLVLEHRSYGYNWLQQIRANDREKKDGFMSYIKQLSKDKITFFIQGGSKDDNKTQTVEYVLKPTEYLPTFRKDSNNWALTAQYVNGHHFLTAFELNEGTMILESPAEDTPSRTLRPKIKSDGLYTQGLWSQRLIYLMKKNELEIHSASFSVIQGQAMKRDSTELWSVELIGDVQRSYLMTAKEPPAVTGGWKEPTFICDLQMPRFGLEPCLIITSCGAYILNTVCSACEWLVGLVVRNSACAERAAGALGAALPPLLLAAADLLMSRGKVAPAHYLYSLACVRATGSQSQPDGWVARLGVFGRLQELSLYRHAANAGAPGAAAVAAKLLACLLKVATNSEETFDMEMKFTMLSIVELQELTSVAAAIGLWDLVPVFSIHRGHPNLLLNAMKARGEMCRGAVVCLLRYSCLVPILLEENGQWLLDFITEKCSKFDTVMLKHLCVWLNPLQDQLRPVLRDLKQGITSVYAMRMLHLISTFMQIACTIEARSPCVDTHAVVTLQPEMWRTHFTARRSVSCGLEHWAVVDEGNAKIMAADTPVNAELIGIVLEVSCGRHHTLVLTENGVYAAGDNTFGQLGVGAAWAGPGGVGAGGASGALLRVHAAWGPPTVSVAAGHYHSAAVDAGGRLYMWGWGVHGQLCLGNIQNQLTPQLVTKFQGRKVLSVGCGSCHTVVLMMNGEVWACGAGVFGQLGSGGRDKSSLPVKVVFPDPIEKIAVGYFHNLALSSRGQLWCWGASPHQVRAGQARRTTPPPPMPPVPDHHLAPRVVDTQLVRGKIVQLSAGWHHSCILNNMGQIYTWGLNFDGQLGTGDRKQVSIPTEVVMRTDLVVDNEVYIFLREDETRSLVACGGDRTVYVDDDGRVYIAGNSHDVADSEKMKLNNKIIMMKTTKRVIKIPATRSGKKFVFQHVDRIDTMFPFDIDGVERKPMEPKMNPLTTVADFRKKTWADDVIILLKPWISDESVKGNPNMAAKLAYHKGDYATCLKLLLDNLDFSIPSDHIYFTHYTDESDTVKRGEIKITLTNVMSKRIKDICLSILNEQPYPVIESSVYHSLPCCCDETKYIKKIVQQTAPSVESNASLEAAKVIQRCVSVFPADKKVWETCFKISKDFYLENKLDVAELEAVLQKFMETNAALMAAAVMFSKDCAQYNEILSPKFYLNMCSELLDTWG